MRLAFFALILTAPLIVRAADMTLLFQPQDMETGPFPSNFLTEPDPAQKTGLRVKLPGVPACIGSPALSCDGVKTLLNQLDGFSLNPQFRFCFSGPIDPTSIKEGIGVVALSPPLSVIGVDQVFYDSNSHCILAKPSQVLKQSTQHLLVITNRIRAKD